MMSTKSIGDVGVSNSIKDGAQGDSLHASKDLSKLSTSSQAIHADDFLNSGSDVAPALHVSTTFRYNANPDLLVPLAEHLYV